MAKSAAKKNSNRKGSSRPEARRWSESQPVHPAITLLQIQGEMGGAWSDRAIGPNTMERVGSFNIEDEDGYKRVEFKAIYELGRFLKPFRTSEYPAVSKKAEAAASPQK
jgi:hypothetical protein